MRVHLQWSVATAVQPSPRVLEVAAMFGLGIDQRRELEIVPPTDLDLWAGQVVFITGPSGSGKSSILRLIARQVEAHGRARLVRLDRLPEPPDLPLVEGLGLPTVEQAAGVLSQAGLGDAFVMLRKPGELSDGQRYRLRLAQAMAMLQEPTEPDSPSAGAGDGEAGCDRDPHTVILADELGTTLDRPTARVIARNIRRWISRSAGLCFIGATTHDDLLEPLDPQVLIFKPLGQAVQVHQRPRCREHAQCGEHPENVTHGQCRQRDSESGKVNLPQGGAA